MSEPWKTPTSLSGLDVIFPASVRHLMPTMEEIPEEFKGFHGTKWNDLVSDWFYSGLKELVLEPKPGIDQKAALSTIKAIIGSFEPAHEHKEAAAAYLLSLWFEDALWERAA